MLPVLASWSPETFTEWFGTTAAFSGQGILYLLVFFVILDLVILPKFKIGDELQKNNMAVAIFLSSCMIAAALIIGKAIGM